MGWDVGGFDQKGEDTPFATSLRDGFYRSFGEAYEEYAKRSLIRRCVDALVKMIVKIVAAPFQLLDYVGKHIPFVAMFTSIIEDLAEGIVSRLEPWLDLTAQLLISPIDAILFGAEKLVAVVFPNVFETFRTLEDAVSEYLHKVRTNEIARVGALREGPTGETNAFIAFFIEFERMIRPFLPLSQIAVVSFFATAVKVPLVLVGAVICAPLAIFVIPYRMRKDHIALNPQKAKNSGDYPDLPSSDFAKGPQQTNANQSQGGPDDKAPRNDPPSHQESLKL